MGRSAGEFNGESSLVLSVLDSPQRIHLNLDRPTALQLSCCWIAAPQGAASILHHHFGFCHMHGWDKSPARGITI